MTQPERRPGMGPLDDCHCVFRRWLGPSYDLGLLDVTLAVAATEQLGGDPPWLLVISGSGNAKTETVVSLAGAGAHITSTIASEGALLSATAKKEKSKDATGGLLRKIGDRGLLVIKDFTSILSMSGDARASVLAALREVYDGKWERNVGTDGGRTLTWIGRIVLIGATTTSYDAAHSVISAMGDRFALVRADSADNTIRLDAGRQSLRNVDQEVPMRAELSEAAAAVLRTVDESRAELTPDMQDQLLEIANLVTLARTAVERDFKGDVIDAHAPEMPTRFAKMLGQIVRGGLSLGMSKDQALTSAFRVAGDTMPPLRLAILGDVADHPQSNSSDVRKRLQKPRTTVDRELQALHILGLLKQDDEEGWKYQLSPVVDAEALRILRTRFCCRSENTPPSPVSHGTAESGEQDQHQATVVPLFADPEAVCPRCRFDLDSNGHALNCETDAA